MSDAAIPGGSEQCVLLQSNPNQEWRVPVDSWAKTWIDFHGVRYKGESCTVSYCTGCYSSALLSTDCVGMGRS